MSNELYDYSPEDILLPLLHSRLAKDLFLKPR